MMRWMKVIGEMRLHTCILCFWYLLNRAKISSKIPFLQIETPESETSNNEVNAAHKKRIWFDVFVCLLFVHENYVNFHGNLLSKFLGIYASYASSNQWTFSTIQFDYMHYNSLECFMVFVFCIGALGWRYEIKIKLWFYRLFDSRTITFMHFVLTCNWNWLTDIFNRIVSPVQCCCLYTRLVNDIVWLPQLNDSDFFSPLIDCFEAEKNTLSFVLTSCYETNFDFQTKRIFIQ